MLSALTAPLDYWPRPYDYFYPLSPIPQTPQLQQGWLCPRCESVNAPWLHQCPSCEEMKKSSNGPAEI